ncbi:PemK family transcriptional regulator [Veronia pacifica]|uniref:PemK family transcriptional regulator n=2 Tax=Veronia pacifica TaxID=1080227 RepID=A0A1C3ELE7_9GAMM|nr:PemK family transcriptional regulator [Veronia pacifica]
MHELEINKGDVFWINLHEPTGPGVDCAHPYVVVQDSILNRSRIDTIVACALTSNRKRANEPGNILLDAGEANLPKQSVVIVSQVSLAQKAQFGEYIGSLPEHRVNQIFSGMRFQQTSFFAKR